MKCCFRKNIRLVVFDLDGTLLDTSEGSVESAMFVAAKLGVAHFTNEIARNFVGPPIHESLVQYCGCSKEDAQKGAVIFRDYYKNHALFKAKFYPGIFEMLQELRNRGIKVGVATYKREDYAIDILKYFGIYDYCDVVHGADNDNYLSKSDIINMCIEEIGEVKKHVLYVGDTEHDAKGAQDAGVSFIAVTWGFGYNKNWHFSKYHVSYFIDSPFQLIEW